jgi:PAS domain S-box-containing protein
MAIMTSFIMPIQRKIAWLLLFSFFSLCFIGWLIYFNQKNYDSTRWWISHTHAVILSIEKVDTRLSDWEELQQPVMPASFRQALDHDLAEVKTLTSDNADEQSLIARLAGVIQNLGNNQNAGALAAAKTILRKMIQEENDLLEQRRIRNRVTTAKAMWTLIGESVLGFLLINIILLRLNKDMLLRRKAERQLQRNQTWLESILDNSTSLIYIKDPLGRYVMANRRFQEVLRVTEEEVIGHTDADFSAPEAAAHYRSLDEEVILSGKSLEIEEMVPVPGGEVYLLSIKFPLLDGKGHLIGIGGIATDITERVHNQQQLIAASREAQSAKSMQEQFLANMSHEIRTPMNGIQGMSDLLLGTPLSDQQREFAKIIKRSVNNLLVIVNDVLDLSKIKAGKLAIEKIEFRLKDVLENARVLFEHRIAKKGLQLLVEIDPAIPETLKGDPYRLNQVLINLIGNAIKFTEQGWIRVEVTAQERSTTQVNLLFSVSDSGIGIPEASIPFLFEHFSQAGLDISRRYGGSGLGLAICQQLLQLQGGEISVNSREKEGTTFQFRLCYGFASPSENTTSTGAAASNQVSPHSLSGKRFLVVEDNEVNQLLIDQVLRRGGGEVRLAGNGEEAIGYLQEGENYDLIIMDLQMPVMDGYSATKYIRQELRLSIPIIAMTATAMVDEQLRCLEVGMSDYMTKPFEFDDLYRRINNQLTPVFRLL